MAKVLWLGDAGCHTGFGRVTHSIGERLVRDYGHDIHVLAINHRGDDFPSTLDPTKKTPLWLYRTDVWKSGDYYGDTRIIEMLGKVEPDVVVFYNDPNVILRQLFENAYDPTRILLQYRPIISYVPCDGTNLPETWQQVQKVTNMLVMSEYGKSMYPSAKLVYHGVDADQFWPVSDERPITTSTDIECRTKEDCKEAFGFDREGFLILRVDKNSGRKDFAATFKALVPVMKRHEDIQVHFHTQSRQMQSGVDINVLIGREPGISPKRWFLPGMTDSWIGWSQQDLNALYNAADLFVSTSRGEGYGLTLVEALACGVPVIAQNVSAIPEVVGPGGMLLEPQRLITVPSGEDLWLADIDAFSDAIEYLYSHPERRQELSEAGVRHVHDLFSWDEATKQFDLYIRALEESVDSAREAPVPDEGKASTMHAASDVKDTP
jgi:glycosyltransferase involved in cell wall biosynthesis